MRLIYAVFILYLALMTPAQCQLTAEGWLNLNELDANYAKAWIEKGTALYYQGKYDDAINAFDEAITLDPNNAKAWSNKGKVLYYQGKYEDAINSYNEAIKLDPNNADTWKAKGFALSKRAIKCYDDAKHSDNQGNFANDSWNYKSDAHYYNQGKTIKAYDEAIRPNPNNATAWINKGSALAGQSKYNEAIKCFDEVIRLNPNHAMAWDNKGLALYYQDKYDEAIKAYNEVIRLVQLG